MEAVNGRPQMLLTTQQVAKKLGISTNTVRVWHKAGKFSGEKVGNGEKKAHYLYHSQSVNEFVKSSNGKAEIKFKTHKPEVVETSHKPEAKTPIVTFKAESPLGRLERIEEKLDQLLKIFS